ncbi:glycosyltransferase family 2 protein [Phenylobacterium terrae]|uniref:Glycosyltransferase family 2 protein n=1 Tax=Phenylobacterium terrae TaxID=2665495 RepID=A0ABW4N387_9CAUL
MPPAPAALRRRLWLLTLWVQARFATLFYILRTCGLRPGRIHRAWRRTREIRPLLDPGFYDLVRPRPGVVSPYWDYVLSGEALQTPLRPRSLGHDPRRAPAQARALLGLSAGATDCRFSVIIPTRDRAALVPEAIGSVLRQTVSDAEVLVVDDASRDGTEAVLRDRFASEIETGRLRLLRGEGRGPAAARNVGLAAARGLYVAYLDSDNVWAPEHLELHAAALERGLASSSRAVGRAPLTAQELSRAWQLQRGVLDMNGFAHERALVDRLGGFDERLNRLEDWDFILRMTRASPAQIIERETYLYRIQPDSVSIRNPLVSNRDRVMRNHALERGLIGLEPLRVVLGSCAAATPVGRRLAALPADGAETPGGQVVIAAPGDLATLDLGPADSLVYLGAAPPPAVRHLVAATIAEAGELDLPRLAPGELGLWGAELAEARRDHQPEAASVH